MMTLKTMISMVTFKKAMIAMVMLTCLTRLKDHRAVWKMQQRGSLGETLLHILIFGNRSPLEHASARALDFQFYETLRSLIHTKIARTLIRHFPNTVQDIIEVIIGTKSTANNDFYSSANQGEEYHGLTPLHLAIAYGNDELAEVS